MNAIRKGSNPISTVKGSALNEHTAARAVAKSAEQVGADAPVVDKSESASTQHAVAGDGTDGEAHPAVARKRTGHTERARLRSYALPPRRSFRGRATN